MASRAITNQEENNMTVLESLRHLGHQLLFCFIIVMLHPPLASAGGMASTGEMTPTAMPEEVTDTDAARGHGSCEDDPGERRARRQHHLWCDGRQPPHRTGVGYGRRHRLWCQRHSSDAAHDPARRHAVRRRRRRPARLPEVIAFLVVTVPVAVLAAWGAWCGDDLQQRFASLHRRRRAANARFRQRRRGRAAVAPSHRCWPWSSALP